MNVHVYDPFLPQSVVDAFGATRHDTVEDVFRACTHITVHAFLSDKTLHMVRTTPLPLKVFQGNTFEHFP